MALPADLSPANQPLDSKTSTAIQVTFLALVALVFFGGAVLVRESKTSSWDPLGDYPVQEVNLASETISVDEGAPGGSTAVRPILHMKTGDEVVPVNATKCNNTNFDVQVHGNSSWKLVNIPGTFIPNGSGLSTRKIGCQQFNYKNPIPAEVKARIVQLNREGVSETVWQIQGSDIPIDGDGRDGIPRYWQTQNFGIHYEGP